MGFCYPGIEKYGDFPPRLECVEQWRKPLLEFLGEIQLTLVNKYICLRLASWRRQKKQSNRNPSKPRKNIGLPCYQDQGKILRNSTNYCEGF
jgi:hypothetical protein